MRQPQGDLRAAALLTIELQRAAMRFGDSPAQIQTQAEPARVPATRGIGAVKRLGHTVEMLG